jgi:hypothetical protein
MSVKKYTTVEVRESKSDRWSTAPNGSARCHDFYTVVVSKQTWNTDVPVYGGLSYKITETYISNSPDTRGQLISSSSSPWDEV